MCIRYFQSLLPVIESKRPKNTKRIPRNCSAKIPLLPIILFLIVLSVNSFGYWPEENSPIANAGVDQQHCEMLNATFEAIPSTGTGSWSFLSGPDSNIWFADISSPWSEVIVPTYGTYVFMWTETDGTNTSSDEVTIHFNEKPHGYASPDYQRVCSDLEMVFIMLSTYNWIPGITYTWTRDNTDLIWGIPESGTGDIIGLLTNWTPVEQVTTFTITPISSSGCAGDPFTAEVFVGGTPEGFSMPSFQDVCSEEGMMEIILSNLHGMDDGTIFDWTRDNTENVIGLDNSGTGNIFGHPVNLTDVEQIVTYTITPTSIDGCMGYSFYAELRVSPRPLGEAYPRSQQVCSEEPIQDIQLSTINGLDPGTTYEWINNATPDVTGLFPAGTGEIIYGVPTNHFDLPQIVTYTITPTSARGCKGEPFTADLIIHPKPLGTATPEAQTVCSNEAITDIVLNINSGWDPGIEYTWVSDNSMNVGGLPNSGSGNISGALINYTVSTQLVTFTFLPTNPEGCAGAPFTSTVTVNPTPLMHVDVSDSILCNEGTALLTISNQNGAVNGTWLYDLEVVADPEISGEIANQTGISKISFAETLSNSDTIAHKVAYNFRPRILADGGGADCNNGRDTSLVIWVNPTPGIRAHADSVICDGETVTIQSRNPNTSIPGTWSHDLLVTADPEISGAGPDWTSSTRSSYTQTLINSDTIAHKVIYQFFPKISPIDGGVACDNGRDSTLVIWVNPTPEIRVSADTVYCTGDSVFINVINPNHSSRGWWNYDLEVNSEPEISGVGTNGSVDLTLPYITESLFNAGTQAHYVEYTFTPKFYYTGAGDCFNGIDTTIRIWVNPTPQIEVSADSVLCNEETSVINISSPNNSLMGEWMYDLVVNAAPEIGGTLSNGEYNSPSLTSLLSNSDTVAHFVDYTFSPIIIKDDGAAESCLSRNNTSLRIWVNPSAQVNPTPDQVLYSNEKTTAIEFTTKNTGGIISYSWINDTPSIGLAGSGSGDIASFEAVNEGTAPKVATITVTPGFSSFGETCNGQEEQFNITVHPKVPVSDAGGDQIHCDVLDTHLEANDPKTGIGAWTQVSGTGTMDFNNPNSYNTHVSATLYGSYQLRWTIASGSDSTQDDVTITFLEEPRQTSAGTEQEVCGSLTTSLGAIPHVYQAGSDHSGSTRQWDYVSGPDSSPVFSDANSPGSQVSVKDYGSYVFRWSETNGSCMHTDELILNFHENPVVDAGADQEICSGDSISLTASGEGSITWDQGVENGSPFAPMASTLYRVTASNEYGCFSSDSVLVLVKPLPQTPAIALISDTLSSNSEVGNQWYLDNGLIPDAENSFYIPTISGTYHTIVTLEGCSSKESNSVYVQLTSSKPGLERKLNIYPNPTADFVRIETGDLGRYELIVTASSGQILLQQVVSDPIYSLDLSPFSYGIYFISIQTPDYTKTRKVIKQ